MTTEGWQQQIDDLEAEIRGKAARLAMLTHAKREALSDTKKLQTLEDEELKLPATIEALKRRVPLLNHELEAALKAEAGARSREIEQQVAEAGIRCAASTQTIRKAMQELLNQISAALADATAHGLLAAEGEYLRVRFGLAPLQIAAGERISAEERARFVRQYENLLRQAPNTQPWSSMRAEFQEAARHKESQRRKDEEARLPNVPRYIHYHHDPGTPA